MGFGVWGFHPREDLIACAPFSTDYEPSVDALSLRTDVISSIKIISLYLSPFRTDHLSTQLSYCEMEGVRGLTQKSEGSETTQTPSQCSRRCVRAGLFKDGGSDGSDTGTIYLTQTQSDTISVQPALRARRPVPPARGPAHSSGLISAY